MAKRNFLLGKGERLAEDIKVNSAPVKKNPPYTFNEAKDRLTPMIESVAQEIEKIPAAACPEDLAVASITLNPEYIAKSYFPSELLRSAGLTAVGSRPRIVKPEKKSGGRESVETITTELFVMGKRSNFKRWATGFKSLSESDPGAAQISVIELVEFPKAVEKLKIDSNSNHKNVYEVVLHLDVREGENNHLSKFKEYLERRKIKSEFKRRFYAGGLCFLELEASPRYQEYIAEFTLVRVLRTMPRLRVFRPVIRTATPTKNLTVTMPDFQAVDKNIKVAIFDGGIPKQHPILRWCTCYDTPGIGKPVLEWQEHGVGVTSAFLFGHIDDSKYLNQPYAHVDHYRVLDDTSGKDPFELYEILDRIKDVLEMKNYDFVNLSLGPQLPISDDEVHAWTAVLDDYLSKRATLATIAVGNGGEGDAALRANRVQVPSDCVNALAIGACDSPDHVWQRARYSSIGPGRSPGITKPDLVEFGGSDYRPFFVLDSSGNHLMPTNGTSFSAPSAMRLASGVKAHFGGTLGPLAIRALMVHSSDSTKLPKEEIGFGRIARNVDDIVLCQDGVVRIVFQGRITASKYIRTPIPIPVNPLSGKVKIKATLCYTTAVDPHHPENYTRSGLEICFRPNKDKRTVDRKTGRESVHAATKSFFGGLKKDFQSELELRRDALKWENCMHSEKSFQPRSLNDPVFDIHYNARMEGHSDGRSQEIEYALIISIEAPKVTDLYDQVVRRYSTILEQLVPIIDLPIRV